MVTEADKKAYLETHQQPFFEDLEFFKRRLFWRDREDELKMEISIKEPMIQRAPTFEDLSQPIPEDLKLWIDKQDCPIQELDSHTRQFRDEGVCVIPGLIPEEICDKYWNERLAFDNDFSVYSGNYMALESMRKLLLYPELMKILNKLIGKPMTLDFVLSGIKSSLREWHQDFYLLPGYVNIDYLAVWVAVNDITPEMGPFEYAVGSHKEPPFRRELVWKYIPPDLRDNPMWPNFAHKFVTPAYADLLSNRNYGSRYFLPKKGDVLIWHSCLIHQGSRPINQEILRPGLIGHYYSIYAQQQRGRNNILYDNDNKLGLYYGRHIGEQETHSEQIATYYEIAKSLRS